MRLLSLCLLTGFALAFGGCDSPKKPDSITTPPPGSSLGTNTNTKGSSSSGS